MSDFIKDNPVTNFSRGFFSPFRAGRFILGCPRLFKYILIPFIINTSVFSLAVYFGLNFFNDTVIHRIPQGDAWYWLILFYTLWVVAALATAVLVFFAFTVVGNLIAAPFNDLLSERTEETLAGRRNEEPFSLGAFGKDVRRTLVEESKKMLFFVLGMVLLLLLNLIPGVGTMVYSVLSVLFTLFFLAVEYTGFVFSRKRSTFRDQRRFIFGRKFLMLGFGVGLLVLLAIPFLQFFCIPVAVVAATQLWWDCSGGGGPASDRGTP
ncbi:MAG: sulfate transporter CysZ [Desulfuromonas sp.]|uniref:sulfate transporter CysZ n=1 Tax=Desulfuromonas sp. TaxID=892 RepID=UPI000CB3401B|nr:sulfate transporter CysZ [Desulfuromonas sp.]PLX85673.1 MAG: sulfate transporter CysZ [Desulfuromonas sp.]